MWWIDRWRQSDSFARMTAEEQGLYRNLCDEVVLRDGGVIPDDPRILAKASGDHEAWGRCGESVLKSMTKVAGGWTNETALQIKAESEKRAKKQKEYRNGLRNKSDNAVGNAADNKPRPPYQEQEQDKEKNQERERRIARADLTNEDFEEDERRLTRLLVAIRDSGQDIQAFLDSVPMGKGRPPYNASRWLRNGRSGFPCSESGGTALKLLCDAVEARQRALNTPQLSDKNKTSFEAIARANGVTIDHTRSRDWTRPPQSQLSGDVDG